jgi:hypothetical protein
MFVLTEKIAPIRTTDDKAAEDAAREKRVEDERWIKRFIDAMAGTLRLI